MKNLYIISVLTLIMVSQVFADNRNPDYIKLKLTDKFYCEGAYYGDFNKDGKMDVVSGPFWYEGTNFKKKYRVRPVKEFKPLKYSDNFLTYTGDYNNDGWTDIFYLPWPGKAGYWYENPRGKDVLWKKHLVLQSIDNESPMLADFDGDGRDELLCNHQQYFGYAAFDPKNPDKEWTYHPITPKGKYTKYTHGVGLGDINGDGRIDFIEREGWWEQPAGYSSQKNIEWKKHSFKFGEAPCQMHAYDVDGDGHNDVITVWHAHKYGLLWYKQIRDKTGNIRWEKHIILSPEPSMKPGEFRISQMHALEMIDMNKDGLKDILVGKRFWAHGPKKDEEPGAPAVIYWFELKRDPEKGVTFIPHRIDDDSGVGCQVAAADLNNDGYPDIIVGNKKGTFVFLSRKK